MSTTTPKLGLTKPAGTDLIDISVLNGNFDILDGAGILVFQTLTDLQTALPSGHNRPVWIVADNAWYYWTGTLSVNVSSVISTSTITAIAPSLSVGGNITVSSVVATASNQALAPVITATSPNVTISAVVATANAQAINPTSAGSSATVYSSDSFTRTNTTSAGSDDQGHAWTALGTTVWGTNGTQLYPSTSNDDSIVVIDSGQSDSITIQGTFATLGGGANRFVWRATDVNNYFLVQQGAGGVPTFYKKAGTFSSLGTGTGTIVAGSVIKVVLSGNTANVYVDGTLSKTITDAFNQTATKHGFGSSSGNSSARFDDFSVKAN